MGTHVDGGNGDLDRQRRQREEALDGVQGREGHDVVHGGEGHGDACDDHAGVSGQTGPGGSWKEEDSPAHSEELQVATILSSAKPSQT